MRNVLITAGATRNYLDAIRFISNQATGKTGLTLLQQLPPQTVVHFLWGYGVQIPETLKKNTSIEEFFSTQDLANRMFRWLAQNLGGLIVHSAAVGDFEVASIDGKQENWEQIKLDSSREISIQLRPTIKIVDQLKKRDPSHFLVSFKQLPPTATSEEATRIGQTQRERTQSDRVFTNITHHLEECQLISKEWVKIFSSRNEALTALIQEIQKNLEVNF
ncbi:MAG: phosphopantothenoylcysteine decarboxylase [Planctomycetota bacterium]